MGLEEFKKDINEMIEEHGVACIEQRIFSKEEMIELRKIYNVGDNDMTGLPCTNEDTGKTFYMNKKRGLMFDFTHKK